jgi:hypothetical protein
LVVYEQLAFREKGYDPSNFEFFFKRMIHKGKRYSCSLYSRQKNICDYCVLLTNGSYVLIQRLLLINGEVHMLVKQIVVSDRKIFKDAISGAVVKHLLYCDLYPPGTQDLSLQHVNSISTKCIYIKIADKKYVTTFPNVFEKD